MVQHNCAKYLKRTTYGDPEEDSFWTEVKQCAICGRTWTQYHGFDKWENWEI